MKGDTKSDTCVDDSCLICGKHPSWGGHRFTGIVNEDGDYEVKDGEEIWLVVEHISRCYLWFCPECRGFYEEALKQKALRQKYAGKEVSE